MTYKMKKTNRGNLDFQVKSKAILKKNSVSGVAAGWFKKVRMGTFFFNFVKKIFLTEKKKLRKKKKNAASLLASKTDTRWTGNRSFF